MRKIVNRVSEFLRCMPEANFSKNIAAISVLAAVLNFTLEAIGRKSAFLALVYMFTSPVGFVLNSLIIMITLTPCLLIKRRMAPILLVSAIWLSLGIANGIVLTYRSNPLSAIDLLVVRSMGTMTAIYFSLAQLILICIGIAAVLFLIVAIIIKCPPFKTYYRKTAVSLFILILSAGLLNLVTVMTKDTKYKTAEISKAYEDLGFVYCFSNSIVSHGVDRPEDYAEMADGLTATDVVYNNDTHVPDLLPNIVVIQLESFIDPSEIKGVEYSEDPTPNFTRLKKEGVSGYLNVPHVGGGTANVEFEILTGMNLDHFGIGEYPYTTVLRTTACESLAANLKSIGYGTHAIHNHIASFYDRDTAYASLGFDTFTPVEMMTDVTRNPLGWAKDEVLTREIVSALDLTDTPDLVFAVSVQGHGKYPEEPLDTSNSSFEADYYTVGPQSNGIKVYNIQDEAVRNQITFYVNQVHEMDHVVGEVLEELESRNEPYVLVVYGDHLPALPIDVKDLANPDLYETEYAIVSNIPFAITTENTNDLDRDIEAYMLSAYVQQLFGFRIGDITALHQHELDSGSDCDDILRTLEYAQLYDDSNVEYEPTSIRFGTRDITVSSLQKSGNTLYIYGSGFNQYTVVRIDGLKRSSELVDSCTIKVENVYFDIKDIEIVQVADNGDELAYAVRRQ